MGLSSNNPDGKGKLGMIIHSIVLIHYFRKNAVDSLFRTVAPVLSRVIPARYPGMMLAIWKRLNLFART
jgi:hypothetical protein